MPANRIDEIYKKGSGSNYSKFNKTKENVSLPKSNKTFSQIYNIILRKELLGHYLVLKTLEPDIKTMALYLMFQALQCFLMKKILNILLDTYVAM